MPELPEVETVLQALKPHVVGSTIAKASVLFPVLRLPLPHNMTELLASKLIINIKRRAKYIMFELEGGLTLLVHLGMTGRLTVANLDYLPVKHDHVIISLNDKMLVYNDPRRFGLIDIIETNKIHEHKLLCNLGPEPLESEFTAEYLSEVLKNRQIFIKAAIMDGKLLVGVGNIYASEALFMAGISPKRKANTLHLQDCEKLVSSIKKVLHAAINSGGSSIRDFVSTDGNKGHFQHHFAVYGKGGKECQICFKPIVKIYQSGRATFFCPNCQL